MKIVNYVLAAIIAVYGLSKLLDPLSLLNILGVVWYLSTAALLVFKPKIGYIFILISILALIGVYALLMYTNSY